MGLLDSIPRVTGGEKQRLKPIPGYPARPDAPADGLSLQHPGAPTA